MGRTIEVSIDNHGGILLPQELKNRLGLLPGMTDPLPVPNNPGKSFSYTR